MIKVWQPTVLVVLYLFLVVYLPCSRPPLDGELRDNFCGKMLDREMMNLVDLPLSLTDGSPHAFVRVGGLVLFIVWAAPAMLLASPWILLFLFGSLFQDAYNGTL